jgi:hypothetical protein
MLTPRQEKLIRVASLKSADVEIFNAHIDDLTGGRREVSDEELRRIVDEALAVARLPYPKLKAWR